MGSDTPDARRDLADDPQPAQELAGPVGPGVVVADATDVPAVGNSGRRARLGRALVSEPFVLVFAVLGLVLLCAAIVYPMLASADPNEPDLSRRLLAPDWAGGEGGLFGTDQAGRDLFLRVMHGLRTTFLVGMGGALVAAFVGTTVGLVAGYFGGTTDAVLMRLLDIQLSVPNMLLVMIVIRTLGADLWIIMTVLGLISWMIYGRLVRGVVLSIRAGELVSASIALGSRVPRLFAAHIVPNVIPALVAVGSLNFASLMLSEATLSFLGFGVQPPTISLGGILASGRDHLATSWWVATLAGLVLMLAVMSTAIVGSWSERMTDPTGTGVAR